MVPASSALDCPDHLLNDVYLVHIGFMYLTSVTGANFEARERRIISGTRLTPPAAYETLVGAGPAAIIVHGVPGSHTTAFLESIMRDPLCAGVVLLFPEALRRSVERAVAATGFAHVDGQLVTSISHAPIEADSPYAYIRNFNSELARYEAAGMTPSLNPVTPADLASSVTVPQALLSGWLSARTFYEALRTADHLVSRAAYQHSLFQQRAYRIDDHVLGRYGGVSTPQMMAQGALCECNQGSRLAHLVTVTADMKLKAWMDRRFISETDDCYGSKVTLREAINILLVVLTDNPLTTQIMTAFNGPAAKAIAYQEESGALTMFKMNRKLFEPTTAAYHIDLPEYISEHLVDVILGYCPATAVTPAKLILDPVYSYPEARLPSRNCIFLMPVYAQQLYLLAQILGDREASFPIDTRKIYLAVKGITAPMLAALTGTYRRSLITFRLNSNDAVFTTDVDSIIVPGLASKGVTVCPGVRAADVPGIARHLAANLEAAVYLIYSEFSTLYQPLVDAFTDQPVSVRERVLIMTTVPHWGDTSVTAHFQSMALTLFHQTFPDPADHTPLAMQAFITIQILTAMGNTLGSGSKNGDALSAQIYREGFVSVGELSLGPFYDCSSEPAEVADGVSAAASDTCVSKNSGARNLVFMSMARVLDPSVAVLSQPTTPSLIYSVPHKIPLPRSPASLSARVSVP